MEQAVGVRAFFAFAQEEEVVSRKLGTVVVLLLGRRPRAQPRTSASALMPASCIDNVSTVAAASRDAVRLALITFASRDLLEPCRAWMRYYTAVEHIRPGDI